MRSSLLYLLPKHALWCYIFPEPLWIFSFKVLCIRIKSLSWLKKKKKKEFYVLDVEQLNLYTCKVWFEVYLRWLCFIKSTAQQAFVPKMVLLESTTPRTELEGDELLLCRVATYAIQLGEKGVWSTKCWFVCRTLNCPESLLPSRKERMTHLHSSFWQTWFEGSIYLFFPKMKKDLRTLTLNHLGEESLMPPKAPLKSSH